MPETEPTRLRWSRLTHSLTAKLISRLLAVMVATFALLGYLSIRLHQHDLEAATLTSAERVSDVIKRTTSYYMLHNDREGLYHAMATMAEEPGMVKVRIFDQEGRISYSSTPLEISRVVDKDAEDCYGCHAQAEPLTHLNRKDRFRIFRDGKRQRVLAVITPIENQPSCSNAACHAHPAKQQILGVLDTHLSLSQADAQVTHGSLHLLAYTLLALLAIAYLSWLFVWHVVGKPLQRLKTGTRELAEGHLGFQIKAGSQDEVGELASSFNRMSLQLQSANEEIVAWAKTLEDRVEQKTRELKRAADHMLQVEKMASIGKMAAVVAHEINNPLSGILTYAKLLRKWIQKGEVQTSKRVEAEECLDLIAGESRRCGDLVKNLLTLSRTAPMNVETTNIGTVIDRSVRLVQHQLEMTGIGLILEVPEDLPLIQCDPAEIEQVLLALIMNAIDAMPRGGNLWLRASLPPSASELSIEVRDDGSGIAPDILPRIFEPFLTTKEAGKGVGLGLAVSRSIIERHRGRIEAFSEPGKGTTFIVSLPVNHIPQPAVVASAETREVKVR
jgi:two-component system, NtrC family, sensor kinase